MKPSAARASKELASEEQAGRGPAESSPETSRAIADDSSSVAGIAATPWEFVQDDVDARRGVARVLDAENQLVCETTPENADLIVCAVNYLVVAES